MSFRLHLKLLETHKKLIPDVSNQTNLLLMNLKSIVDKLQSEKAHLKIKWKNLKLRGND